MGKLIAVKINVKKLDKSKFFEGKNGALYADIVLMENRDGQDQYGNDFMVVQGSTKEEREAGQRGAILGNAKYIGGGRSQNPKAKIDPEDVPQDNSDPVPF